MEPQNQKPRPHTKLGPLHLMVRGHLEQSELSIWQNHTLSHWHCIYLPLPLKAINTRFQTWQDSEILQIEWTINTHKRLSVQDKSPSTAAWCPVTLTIFRGFSVFLCKINIFSVVKWFMSKVWPKQTLSSMACLQPLLKGCTSKCSSTDTA